MVATPVTQGQFNDFKIHIDSKFEDLKNTLKPIIDPVDGLFIQMNKNNDAIKKAHERLDGLYLKSNSNQSILRGTDGNPGILDDIRELKRFRKTIVKIIWIIITPILGALGFALWAFFTQIPK